MSPEFFSYFYCNRITFQFVVSIYATYEHFTDLIPSRFPHSFDSMGRRTKYFTAEEKAEAA